MMNTESLAPSEIGERLRIAREDANLTQATAAKAIGIARTTLIAIEQGKRRVKMIEIRELAKLYRTNANSLLRKEAVYVDLAPRFRKMPSVRDADTQTACKLLSNLAKAEVELENLLGVQRISNYPPERPLKPGNVEIQAENDALELRQRIGLGLQPVLDITALLELEFGIRIYMRRFDGKISGLFAYDDKLGACILLNANHPRERRTYTAAHELGHLISTRRNPDVFYAWSSEKSPEERYANAFARSFLTPSRTVIDRFHEITAGSTKLTRRHVIILAYSFGVSREAIVRRLEELGQTNKGAWDWFESNGGITDRQVRQVLGDLVTIDRDKMDSNLPITFRLTSLANEAWRQKLLSEGQLAHLLKLDRIQLRETLDELETGEEAGNEAPMLFR